MNIGLIEQCLIRADSSRKFERLLLNAWHRSLFDETTGRW